MSSATVTWATTKRAVALAVLVLLSAGSVACESGVPAGAEPHYEFNFLDMADQPKLKPQRVDLFGETPVGMTAPPAGAVAIGEYPYPFAQKQADAAAAAYDNPLEPTPEVLARGAWVWTHTCITCHGPEAAGDGQVTKKGFPAPPSLLRQVPRDYTDARIFHVPMRGQGSMPSYANQLEPYELWSVVHTIRAFQHELPVAPPSKQDLEAQRQTGLDEEATP